MSNIFSYFDLNRRIVATTVELTPTTKRGFAAPPKKGDVIPLWKQIVFYLSTLIGVLFSSAVIQYQAGKLDSLNITLTAIILSAIIALVIIPNFYAKVIKPDAAFLVQLGLFAQHGVFWSVLLSTIGKAFG